MVTETGALNRELDSLKLEAEGPETQAPPISPAEGLRMLFGRTPLLLPELLAEINRAGWPETAYVHPADFFVLTTPITPMAVYQVHKDQHGPYFYLSRTKIRPSGVEVGTVADYSDWTPPGERRVTLAKFSG